MGTVITYNGVDLWLSEATDEAALLDQIRAALRGGDLVEVDSNRYGRIHLAISPGVPFSVRSHDEDDGPVAFH